MITTMGQGHTLREKLLAILSALAIFASLIAVFAPAASAAIDIAIPIDTVIHAPVGSETLLATVSSGDLVGQQCSVSADAVNQNSVHPGNDLVVASDASSVLLENVEGVSNGTVHADGILTLSDTITVTLVMGPDHVFSAGITVLIDCDGTTTTTSTTTTTTTSTTSTTTTTTTTTTTPTQDAQVTVTANSCVIDEGGVPVGSVGVVISPDGSATVAILDVDGSTVATFTASDSVELEPGDYTWTADAADGFVLDDTSGSFSIDDCDEAEVSDLEITKIDLVDPVVVNTANPKAQITYEITVTNNGPSVAENVVVTDTLPASLTYLSADPGVGSCAHSGGTVTCDLGDMAAGDSVLITVVVETEAVGAVTDLSPLNVVEVDSDTDDNNPDNNSDDEETEITEVLDTEVTNPDVLPFTGAESDAMIAASIALLGMGVALLWVSADEDEETV